MERDKGIEPSPRPWQGRVLPLYESRFPEDFSTALIYSMRLRVEQEAARAFLDAGDDLKEWSANLSERTSNNQWSAGP